MVLASSISQQLDPITSFFRGIPTILIYVIAVLLFMLIAKSERLDGGLSFRHLIFALAFGLLGSVLIPASWMTNLSTLAKPGYRLTADAVFAAIILAEFILIGRNTYKRRKAGAE